MAKPRFFPKILALALTGAPMLSAQDLAATGAPKAPVDLAPAKSASDGSIQGRRDARTITLKIPAPRGQIVDREGQPLAQSEVAYQVGLQFSQFENADRDFVVHWARTRLDALQPKVKNFVSKSDDELFDHYRHRRWLPLLVTGQIGEKEARSLESKLGSGLILHPVYRRFYPHQDLAAHILGYSGSVGKLPTGPINFNEPLWEESEGRAGLEKIHDLQLAGDPGMKRLLFDENGNKLLEEQVKRPKPGGTLVTTLNLKWQQLAEKVLKEGSRRGAFVVIDVATGEVLVMASRPAFDLNNFIPGISDTDFKALEADPAQPLFGRAFQSAYPPASAFKPVVALAALNNGVVTEYSTVYCPASVRIGNHTFNNWSKVPEGSINVKRALARSTNPWFYQVGIDVGPNAFLDVARRLGFGEKSGLPLMGETTGLVPNDQWMLKNEGRKFLDGDTANLSIGQGSLLASPIQVAQAMAGIANGGALPKLQLIHQVQDTRGRVVQANLPSKRNLLGLDSKAVEIVRDGMRDVVSTGYGTGRSAALSYTTLCGKTGTAQWGPPSKNQRLAWFAGFLPHDNPRYAFAVLYEGRPGETVSGGRMAAPMVRNFFEPIKEDIEDIIAPPKKALVVVDETDGTIPSAEPVPEETEALDPIEGGPLRALPVTPEEVDALQTEMEDLAPPVRALPVEPRPEMVGRPLAVPIESEPIRALPVSDDEIIDDGTDEP